MSNVTREYAINSTSGFADLMGQVNTFSNGALGPLMLMAVFSVSFFSLQNSRTTDAVQASAWVTWLSSVFLVLIGILPSQISVLLLIIVLAITAYQSQGTR
jgi:hypothetical membrane protein